LAPAKRRVHHSDKREERACNAILIFVPSPLERQRQAVFFHRTDEQRKGAMIEQIEKIPKRGILLTQLRHYELGIIFGQHAARSRSDPSM